MNRKSLLRPGIIVMILMLASGCSGPEEKKMRFFEKGNALYDKGDFMSARLELKNAVQIDSKFTEAYFLLGMACLKNGNLNEALTAFSRTVSLNPGHLKAQVELGKLFLAGREPDKAEEKADLVIKEDPGNEEGVLLKASVLLLRNDMADASTFLTGQIEKGSTHPEVYLLLAACYSREKRAGNAEETLLKGVDLNPSSVALRLALVDLYASSNRMEPALKGMEEVILLEPDQPRHKETLAALYWKEGEKKKAMEVLRAPVRAAPEDEGPRLRLARFLAANGQYEEARKELEQGIEKIPKSFDLRFTLSELLTKINEPAQAVRVLKDCIALGGDRSNPKVLQAKATLAEAQLMLRDLSAAETSTKEILKQDARSLSAHFILGKVYMAQGKPSEAVTELRTVTNDRPDFVPAALSLAAAHEMNGEQPLAIDVLLKALDTSPRSKNLRMALAGLYLKTKDTAQGEAQMKKLLEYYPNDSNLKADLGDFNAAAGDAVKAEKTFIEVKENHSESPLGSLKLAQLYAREKKWGEALRELQGAYRKNPDSRQVLEFLVDVSIRLNKYDEALNACKDRIGRNPEDARAYNLSGKVQAAREEYDKAETSFDEAIRLEPTWPEPYNNLAGIYLAKGKTGEAAECFEAALKNNPRNVPAYLGLGRIYCEANQYKEAKAVYARALESYPALWPAVNNLAFLTGEYPDSPRDLDKALELARKANDLQPGQPGVMDTLGWVYYKLGDTVKSLSLLEDLPEKEPDKPIFKYHLGMALYKDGREDEAKKNLSQALGSSEHFAGREEAERTLARLQSQS